MDFKKEVCDIIFIFFVFLFVLSIIVFLINEKFWVENEPHFGSKESGLKCTSIKVVRIWLLAHSGKIYQNFRVKNRGQRS